MHSKNKIPLQHLYNTTGKAKSKDKRSAKTLAEVQTVDRRSADTAPARVPPLPGQAPAATGAEDPRSPYSRFNGRHVRGTPRTGPGPESE